MLKWFTTNKQLRADIKRMEAAVKERSLVNAQQRAQIIGLEAKLSGAAASLRLSQERIGRLEAQAAALKATSVMKTEPKLPSHIEGMRHIAKVGSVIPNRLLQDEPGRQSSKLSKTLADKPDARRVVRDNYPAPTRQQDTSSSGSTDFLTGAIIGMVANEIFSSNSETSSSNSCSSDSGISSGGGGDFGGGGASGSFD